MKGVVYIKHLKLVDLTQYYVNIPLSKLNDLKDLAQALPLHKQTYFNNLLKYLKTMEMVCEKIDYSTNKLNALVDEIDNSIVEKEKLALYLELKKTYKQHMHYVMMLQKITPFQTRKEIHKKLMSIIANYSWHWFFLAEAYYHVDSDLIYQQLEDIKTINKKIQEFEMEYKIVWNEEIKYLINK